MKPVGCLLLVGAIVMTTSCERRQTAAPQRDPQEALVPADLAAPAAKPSASEAAKPPKPDSIPEDIMREALALAAEAAEEKRAIERELNVMTASGERASQAARRQAEQEGAEAVSGFQQADRALRATATNAAADAVQAAEDAIQNFKRADGVLEKMAAPSGPETESP